MILKITVEDWEDILLKLKAVKSKISDFGFNLPSKHGVRAD